MSAIEIQNYLRELHVERTLALADALVGNAAHMADLEHEIAETRRAYVEAAVTEIATLRGRLSGPQLG